MPINKKQYLVSEINAEATSAEKFVSDCEKSYAERLNSVFLAAADKKIILVSGPSASGKTTTALRLSALCRDSVVVSMDDFYKDREDLPIIDGKVNAEVIEALDLELLETTLSEFIKTGKTVLPRYDFKKGKRFDREKEVVGKTMIIEGLHALNPDLRESLPKDSAFALYVSPHSYYDLFDRKELRFLRRLVRDYYHRAATAEVTFEMWKDVSSCEDVFVRPLGKTADAMLDTTHLYEICVIKNEADAILSGVSENGEFFAEATALRNKLSQVKSLPISVVPESSLLKEFLPLK